MNPHIFWPVFLTLFLWSGPVSATAPATSDLVEAAYEAGYTEGNMERVLGVLERALEQDPDNLEVQELLARALLTVGRVDQAQIIITGCVESQPGNPGCRFAEVLATYMASGEGSALTLARSITDNPTGLDGGMTTPFLLTLADLLWRTGDLAAAENVLRDTYTGLAELAHVAPEDLEEGRRVPLHPAIALAHVYEATGRPELAAGLRAHVALVHANLLQRYEAGDELAGFQLWNLAATGAGVEEDKIVLGHLDMAVRSGFVMDWRYNIANHPVFWPLRNHAGFRAIIASLEDGMPSISRN